MRAQILPPPKAPEPLNQGPFIFPFSKAGSITARRAVRSRVSERSRALRSRGPSSARGGVPTRGESGLRTGCQDAEVPLLALTASKGGKKSPRPPAGRGGVPELFPASGREPEGLRSLCQGESWAVGVPEGSCRGQEPWGRSPGLAQLFAKRGGAVTGSPGAVGSRLGRGSQGY